MHSVIDLLKDMANNCCCFWQEQVKEIGGGAITSKDKFSAKAYKGRHIGHEARQPLSMEGAKRPRLRPCIVNAIDTLPPYFEIAQDKEKGQIVSSSERRMQNLFLPS